MERFRELFEVKESFWIVSLDNVANIGPLDGPESAAIDSYMKMVWKKIVKDSKLIKTTEKPPRDARGYEFKKFKEIMDDNFKLSNAEQERLGL